MIKIKQLEVEDGVIHCDTKYVEQLIKQERDDERKKCIEEMHRINNLIAKS